MDLAMHAEVYCTDGLFGHTTGLIVYPAAKRVSHVIVEERSFARTEYLVPLGLIARGTTAALHLRQTRREVADMKPFVESVYLLAGQEYWSPVTGEPMGPFGAMPGALLAPEGLYEEIPAGESTIHRYARVEARDGHVGRVDEVQADPAHGAITALVLREGHLWGQKDVTIPIAAIARITDDTIHLTLGKREIAALPATPVHRSRHGAHTGDGEATTRD
jgi:hypothetical protein